MLAISDGHYVRVIHATSGNLVSSTDGGNEVKRAQFLSSSRLIISSRERITVWDVQGNKEIARIPAPGYSFEFLLDQSEQFVAIRGNDSNPHPTEIWDLKGRRLIQIPHKKPVRDVAFSLDSRYVATTSADGAVTIGDLRSQVILPSLDHVSEAGPLAFSTDSAYLAADFSDVSFQRASMRISGRYHMKVLHTQEVRAYTFRSVGICSAGEAFSQRLCDVPTPLLAGLRLV
jgi:WD40 repeat protein